MKLIFQIFVALCLLTGSLIAAFKQKSVNDVSWDFLILAQFWPGTSCVHFGNDCLAPPKLNAWTIHGLWPSNRVGPQPESCNDSMEFDYQQIKTLGPKLDQQWPNMDKSGDRTYLWQHEWDKHGTCAYTLPLLQGELEYFNQTLRLQQHINLFRSLNKSKISPTMKKTYNLTDIHKTISIKYKIPRIRCETHNDKLYLAEIWLCFNKSLAIIDCPKIPALGTTGDKDSRPLRFVSENWGDDSQKSATVSDYFLNCTEDQVYYPTFPHWQL